MTSSIMPKSCCLLISARAAIRPFKASIHWLRLFLRVLKSPLYVSVIFGGMLPFEISSTYFAATFSGLITASRTRLKPSITGLHSKYASEASDRVCSFPSTAAVAKRSVS